MALPDQLLLSDLLRRQVRCEEGQEHGIGVLAWMHPPVHRLLGWISKPSNLGSKRLAWRLNQLRGLGEQELFVQGEGADTDLLTVERLPTLIDAALIGQQGQVLGSVADAAVELSSGRILHYLVARSDPRLPGSSRWRLTPDRLLDQQPGQVVTALTQLDELPLARASVRQEFLRRSRRWRDQIGEETSRLRDQFQEVGDRFEERLEGWLEEPDGPDSPRRSPYGTNHPYADSHGAWEAWGEAPDPDPYASRYDPPGDRRPPSRPDPRQRPVSGQDLDSDEDPWI
jgi:hypothetical protein